MKLVHSITGASWTSYDRDVLEYNSQEVRLTSAQDQPLTWLVGAFSYQEDTSGASSGVIQRNAAGVVSATPLRPKSAGSVKNDAQFGRMQYELSKQLQISAEGRYSKETIKTGGTALGTAIVTAGTCVTGQQSGWL